jgi:hypothetical protein
MRCANSERVTSVCPAGKRDQASSRTFLSIARVVESKKTIRSLLIVGLRYRQMFMQRTGDGMMKGTGPKVSGAMHLVAPVIENDGNF